MEDFGMHKTVTMGFDETVVRITEKLAAEGFGVLTDIDLAEAFKNKLGVSHSRYRILGACNPPLAHRAVTALPEIGLMLPCNVVVREGAGGSTIVSVFDPMAFAAAGAPPAIREIAEDAAGRLSRALAAL